MASAVVVATLIAGCAAYAPKVWDRAGGATQEEFDKDMAQCEFEGEKIRNSLDPTRVNTETAKYNVRMSCMKARGYYLRDA